MPYVYKPYPKWIEADGKRFIVKDEAEHKKYPSSIPAPEGIEPVDNPAPELPTDRDSLIKQAEAGGIKIDKRWSTERIKAALDDNSGSDNHERA